MFSNAMLTQPLLSSFIPKIKKAFEEYLDNKTKSRKTLMIAKKHIDYLQYLAHLEQKIHKTDKVETKQLKSIKQQVINEFSIDSRGLLLYVA